MTLSYGRGSTFPLFLFLTDGPPKPKTVGTSISFGKNDVFVYLVHGIFHRGKPFDFFLLRSFCRMGYDGAPQVRGSLGKFKVNLSVV